MFWVNCLHFMMFPMVAQIVKAPPALWETWVPSLRQKCPLEEGMATHSSILSWEIPMDRGAWGTTVYWVTKKLDTTERLSTQRSTILDQTLGKFYFYNVQTLPLWILKCFLTYKKKYLVLKLGHFIYDDHIPIIFSSNCILFKQISFWLFYQNYIQGNYLIKSTIQIRTDTCH